MRIPLIACILAATGLTFFAATRSIDAMSREQNVLPDPTPLQAELDAVKARYQEKISSLEATKTQQAAQHGAIVSELENTLKDVTSERNAASQAQTELTAKLTVLEPEVRQSKSALAEAQMTILVLNSKANGNRAKLRAAKSQLTDAQAQATTAAQRVASLEAELAQVKRDNPAAQISELQARVRSAEDALSASNDRVAALLADMELKGKTASKALETAARLETKLARLNTKLDETTRALSARDDELQTLRASTIVPVAMTAELCTQQTSDLMSGEKIAFKTGTDTIDEASFALLDRLADIAFDCAHNNLNVLIGGHTDSQGGERSNQVLSEKRAAAVRSFFGARGLPAASMLVAGYGETRPIADNSSSDGRSKNRRITFDWQQR